MGRLKKYIWVFNKILGLSVFRKNRDNGVFVVVIFYIMKGNRRSWSSLESRMMGNYHVRFGKGFLTNEN